MYGATGDLQTIFFIEEVDSVMLGIFLKKLKNEAILYYIIYCKYMQFSRALRKRKF